MYTKIEKQTERHNEFNGNVLWIVLEEKNWINFLAFTWEMVEQLVCRLLTKTVFLSHRAGELNERKTSIYRTLPHTHTCRRLKIIESKLYYCICLPHLHIPTQSGNNVRELCFLLSLRIKYLPFTGWEAKIVLVREKNGFIVCAEPI